MSTSENPATIYRDAVRKSFFRYQPAGSNEQEQLAHLRLHIQQNYIDSKERLTMLISQGETEKIQTERLGIAVLALGLLAFGNIEVVDEILDAMPIDSSLRRLNVYRLLSSGLRDMLPLPKDMNPLTNPDEVRAWFLVSRDNLRWQEELGRYVII